MIVSDTKNTVDFLKIVYRPEALPLTRHPASNHKVEGERRRHEPVPAPKRSIIDGSGVWAWLSSQWWWR